MLTGGLTPTQAAQKLQERNQSEPIEPTDAPEAEPAPAEESEPQGVGPTESETEETPAPADPVQEEEPEPEDPVYQIGDLELTESEIKAWKSQAEEQKKGGMLEADYRKKTTELSHQRKAIEQLSGDLTGKIDALENLLEAEDKQIDWAELRDYDPGEYLKAKEKVDAKKAAIEQAKLTKQNLIAEKAKGEALLLTEANPAWVDEKVRDADVKVAMEFAEKVGFKQGDLNKITDHRIYQALIKAGKYDALELAATDVKKKIKQAPKVLKPKARTKSKPQTDFDSVKNRLRKTGSKRDAQAAIKMLLERRNK